MAFTAAVLATCRAAALLLPEYAAFTAALAALSAASEEDRQARWNACYNDAQPMPTPHSPAYRLRRQIRNVILNNATSDNSPADTESAYQTLAGDLAPDMAPPTPLDVAPATFTAADLDLLRIALENISGGSN